jgi:hypothetical protein
MTILTIVLPPSQLIGERYVYIYNKYGPQDGGYTFLRNVR